MNAAKLDKLPKLEENQWYFVNFFVQSIRQKMSEILIFLSTI